MKYAIIHIADIHYKKNKFESSELIINSFLDDVSFLKENYKDYIFYLIITGDIVYEGKDLESYEKFLYLVNERLDELGISKNFRISIPGNHDIDRKELSNNIDSYKKKIDNVINDEQLFNDFLEKNELNEEIFTNYLLFENEFSKYNFSKKEYVKNYILDKDLCVCCLNSAITSFGGLNEIDDYNRLAIDTRNLEKITRRNKCKFNILISHHPADFFTNWSEGEVVRIIENNFQLCLSGHNHKQDVNTNKLNGKSIVCSAPQLFTSKKDSLGYAVILVEDNSVNKIVYRQYVNGKFLNGQYFSNNSEGIIYLKCEKSRCVEILQKYLDESLVFFKGYVGKFIKPKLSLKREFNDDENLLDKLISNPEFCVIVAQPQFGLSCLAHFMRLEAYKNDDFWIYIDAKHDKCRNIESILLKQLEIFKKETKDIKCIIIDSWEDSVFDNRNILLKFNNDYEGIPIIILSNYNEFSFKTEFDFDKLKNEYKILHLQALQREKVREFVSNYNHTYNIGDENLIVDKIICDLEVLNIHRTPLNCLTLLKITERYHNEDLINRSKMIKTVLFILFTDTDSFTYSSIKPNVDECEFVLGKYCSEKLMSNNRIFEVTEFKDSINKISKENLIAIDIDLLIDILLSNNILIQYNGTIEFKHSYWIYYFSAMYMYHDDEFKNYIFDNKNYVNFTEIIEFYTGHDGKRDDAIQFLMNDLNQLIKIVDEKIGIKGEFNPFSELVWNPSDSDIFNIENEISKKIENSNLPPELIDKHNDKTYNSESPYNQSIDNFLNEFSVVSLLQATKASSKALRNSSYVSPALRRELFSCIVQGWESLSKVFFWIAPKLAMEGKAIYDGLGVSLLGDFDESRDVRLKQIITCNLYNVVTYFKDSLSSKKIGPLLFDNLEKNTSDLQKHLIGIYLIRERPIGWNKEIFEFMNLIHKNSFMISDFSRTLSYELEYGYLTNDEKRFFGVLIQMVVAKHKYLGYSHKTKNNPISSGMIINEKNKIPIDRILSQEKKPKFLS